MRNVEDEQEAIKKELDEQAQSNLDLSELKATVVTARKAGDLEQRLADSQKHATDEKAACEGEFSRLGRFSGTLEAFSKIAMPVSETLDRFERLLDELADNMRDEGRRQKEVKRKQKQAEQDLKTLLLTSDVPTISELEEARLVRNTGWNLIKRKYIEAMDVEKNIAEFASDSDLQAFYEQKVEVADNVADRLRSAADQVVKRADLEAKIETLTSRHNDITEEVRKVNVEKEASQKEWNSIWERLGINSGSPREMKQWLLRIDQLLANVQTANTVSGDTSKLAEACNTLKESVALQISKFDDSIDVKEMSLEAIIHMSEERIEREEATLERKRQLEHSLNNTEIRVKRTREELTSIKNDQANWAQEWGQAIDGLGLKPDVHPEQATEAFDQLLAYIDKFDKSEELRKRIYGIDQVVKNFEKKSV